MIINCCREDHHVVASCEETPISVATANSISIRELAIGLSWTLFSVVSRLPLPPSLCLGQVQAISTHHLSIRIK